MGAGHYSLLITESAGNTITASSRNSEHQNHITNHNFDTLDDYSTNDAQAQAQTEPGTYASPSLATTGSGEIERLRMRLAQVIGGSNNSWLDVPTTNLGVLTTVGQNLHIGLEFEGALGGASSTTNALAKFINQGGIINAASLSSADVVAADFGTSNVKFGKYSYSLASGNIMAFPGHHGNPIKGTISSWFRNLAAGDYIAYNPLLGIELYMDGTSLLTLKATEAGAASESTKSTNTVVGSTARTGDSTFRNVVAKWRFNDESGASTDLFELEYEGADEGTQLTAQDIDINPGAGGVWFIGAKRNDPSWDHFYAANDLPTAHSDAWTKSGTFTASVSGGVLNLSASSLAAVQKYTKTNNIDLANMTVEWKMRVNSLTQRGAVNEDVIRIKILDTAVDRGIGVSYTKSSCAIIHTESGSISAGDCEAQFYFDTTQWHTYRLTSTGGGGSDSDITWKFYVDGVLVGSETNQVTDTTASEVSFGSDETASHSFNWDLEYFKYHDATASPPVAASSQGELDSFGISKEVLSDNTITLLQSSRVTDVLGQAPKYGVYLPPTSAYRRVGVSVVTTGATLEQLGNYVYYIAGDGVSELQFKVGASITHSAGSVPARMCLDVDTDMIGKGGTFEYGGARFTPSTSPDYQIVAERSIILTPGLHTIKAAWQTDSGTLTLSGPNEVFFSRAIAKQEILG